MITCDSPKHAVILAAGLGSRLRPLTDHRPKPLIEVHGVPILHNALCNLAAAGVQETTIVVGYRHESIKRCCTDTFAGMRISYIESTVFDRTGSAYSLWLARSALERGDTLILEGDVFFDAELLTRLLGDGDVAAIDSFDETVTGSAALVAEDGRVLEFRMNQSALTVRGAPLYKTVNLYRFTAHTLAQVIVPALERLIGAGDHKCYVEQVLAQLIESGVLKLRGAFCTGVRWFEIDSAADLQRAEQIFQPAKDDRPFGVQPAYQAASVGGTL